MAIVQVSAPTRVGSWRGPNGESDPEELLPFVLHGASVAEHTGTATDANPMQVDAGAAEQTEVPQALDAGTIVATAGDGKVTISEGTPPSGGTGSYTRQLYRSTSSGTKGSALSGATSLPYEDEDVENDETYYYTLTVSDGETTADTPQVSATPQEPDEDWPVLSELGFEIVRENALSGTNGATTGWTYASGAGSYVNGTTDVNAPLSPPNIGRARYTTSFEAGNQPFYIYADPGSGNEMVLAFWFRLSANWYGHPTSGVNKIFFIWNNAQQGGYVYLSAQGYEDGPLEAQVRIQSPAPDRNLAPNKATGSILRDNWYRWETYLNSDGTIKWWLTRQGQSRVLVGDYADVNLGSNRGFSLVQWAPTWGGIGGNPPETQFMDMDHIIIARPA